ncbi:DUF6660 family protein [Emticicia sp. TH156]|uniref:DUF6660 family protein n=1 Tax=Emticicia sp. TH156 TaxID=2067454 RepID=UPI0038D3DFB4
MRLFAFIFCFYLLAISLMPCGDEYNVCNNERPGNELAQNQNHNHKTDHNDICGPLCACCCCSTPVNIKVAVIKIKVPRLLPASKEEFPNRSIVYVSDFFGNIWQPPKSNA